MTLNVDIRDIKNRDTVCFNKEENKEPSVGRQLIGLPYSDVTNYLSTDVDIDLSVVNCIADPFSNIILGEIFSRETIFEVFKSA